MTTATYRVEHDSMGALEVPATALWGAQTQRAIQNFPPSGLAKVLGVTLTKIANDLRWMNSGPLAGLGADELRRLPDPASLIAGGIPGGKPPRTS